MSKKFEYELMLRLEKAEKAIASLASKIEKDLGKAVETAFRGASEFDVVKFSKNIGSRIEQDVSSALKQAFSGSSEFDFSKRVASSVEQDVKAALQSAFSGSSEFSTAGGGDVEKVKQAALALDANQRSAADYTLQLEQQRLAAVRERVNLEVNAFVTSRKEARAAADAEQARIREAKQQALEGAFSGGVPLDLQEKADQEAFDKKIAKIRQSSETQNQVADQDYQREIARSDGLTAHLEERRKHAEAKVAEENRVFAERADQRDKKEKAHGDRLEQNNKLLKKYYDTYKDPSTIAAIDSVRDSLTNHSASLKVLGTSVTEQNKEHKKFVDSQIEGLDKLVGKEQKASVDRIAQIRESTKADQAAQAIRYQQHHTVLEVVQQAHLKNAEDLISIEQRITTMTEAEAKQQLIAYQKTAKARVDYAIEQGYKLEAIEARNSANGARSVSAIFQVQQAIEDSMYAGLRGAGNNIAMLLTSISSSWVAIGGLIGIATLQLASHLGVFDKLNEAMDGALWKTKEQVRQEEYLARIRREDWERRQKQPIEAVDFDPRGKSVESAQEDTAAAEKKLAILKEQQEALQLSIAAFERLKDKANEIEAAYGTRDTANLGRLVREYIEIKAAFDAGNTGLDVKSAGMFEAMFGDGLKLSGGGLDELKKRWEDAGSAVAEAADKLAVYREEEERVLEVQGRKAAQEALKEATLENIETQIEASQAVVKSREDELQAIQKAVEASQRALEIEERRADAIRKAASARDDEFAKQKLGLENTILDMEANEKAKIAKDKAGSAEEKIKGQLAWAKQWAEQQAKIDKVNNPQNGSNIAAAKDQWINNQEQQAQAALDRIKKTEQAEIESAKKVAEQAKKANLDAMKAAQMEKAADLIEKGHTEAGWFGADPRKAIEFYEEAQKTLKEIQNAEIANLKEKDSVQQGKAALKEIEALQEQLKQLDEDKLDASKKAQELEKENILREMAREDQAAARLEQAKAAHDELLEKKQQINKVSLINPNDLDSIGKFRRELEIIMGMLPRTGMGPMPAPGMGSPGGGSAGGAGGGAGGEFPTGPVLPGNSGFSLTFNMNNATPNSVAAAANSIVQSQKAMAMLSGV